MKRILSPAALRLLRTLRDGHSITGVREDVYHEVKGLIGPAPPCLPYHVLTPEGVSFLAEQDSLA